MKKTYLFLCILFLSASHLFSADLARIMGGKGTAFTLIREGATYFYDLNSEDIRGMKLNRGDTLMTEADTFLEIHLLKGSTVLIMAGNTTLSIEQLDKDGGGVFRLGYGRVRAKVNSLSPRAEFYLITDSVAVGNKGKKTDFGMDYLYISSGKDEKKDIRTSVYSFEGDMETAIFPNGTEIRGKKIDNPRTTINLSSKEMTEIFTFTDLESPKKQPVSDEIIAFWNMYAFEEIVPQTTADGQNSLMSSSDMTWTVPQGEGLRSRMRKAGSYTFGLGAGVVSLGLLSALFNPSEDRSANYLFAGFGGLVSLIGAGFIFGSYLAPDDPGSLPSE